MSAKRLATMAPDYLLHTSWSAAKSMIMLRLLALALLIPLAALDCLAREPVTQSMEYEIKAAFLSKFAQYITWPESAFATRQAPLTVGLAAPDNFIDLFRRASADKTYKGRPISIKHIRGDTDEDLHLLFVARSHEHLLPHLKTQLRGQPTLIVTESEMGLDAGAAIDFAIDQNRVRFDINMDQARSRNLQISAQLLHVARKVEGVQ